MARREKARLILSFDGERVAAARFTMDGIQQKEIRDLFGAANGLKLSDVNAPKKSLKELKIEEAEERARRIKEHERRFEQDAKIETSDFVNDDLFLGREDESQEADICVSSTNIFEDDWNSLKIVSEPEIQVETITYRLKDLHASRPTVKWDSEVLEKLKSDGKRLKKYQSLRRAVRYPDYKNRIKLDEKVNVTHKMKTSEETRNDELHNVKCDFLGLSKLLPHKLQSVKKTNTDINGTETFISVQALKTLETKKAFGLIKDLHDMSYIGPNSKIVTTEKQFEELNTKLAVLETMVITEKDEVGEHIQQYDLLPETVEESRKRKTPGSMDFTPNGDGWKSNSKRVFEGIADGSSSSEKVVDEESKLREQLLEEQRKAARRKRLLEESRKRAAEENERKERERKEEGVKKKMKEDEERRQFEMAQEEERKRQQMEEEMAQRLQKQHLERMHILRMQKEKEEREAEKAREEEELRQKMAEQQRIVDLEQLQKEAAASYSDDSVSVFVSKNKPIILQKNWRMLKIKRADNWKAKKEAMYNRYKVPIDEGHRIMEHDEYVKKIANQRIANGKPAIIPQENTNRTSVYSITIPKKVEKKKKTVKETVPVVPRSSDVTAKQLRRRLSRWIRPYRPRALFSLKIQELRYDKIHLDDLKSVLCYPFHMSDGMYWPVFFGLKKTDLTSHVKALVTCKTFSGKYASHLLLTSSLSEDKMGKTFERNYADCDGDWSDYSRKPGRFSNRKGFSAIASKCQDSFEDQRNRAVRVGRDWRETERRERNEFQQHRRDFESDRDERKYSLNYKNRLRQLIRDARLDVYSPMETSSYRDKRWNPGTRDSQLEPRWHNHGYSSYLRNRDIAYGDMMNRACKNYENLLPCIEDHEGFEEWALLPMLASLYYQTRYNGFKVHSSAETRAMEERKKAYMKLVNGKKFSLDAALKICKLTKCDKELWTILNDQLVSHFKDYPTVSALIYDETSALHECTKQAVEETMETVCKHVSNGWRFDFDSQ